MYSFIQSKSLLDTEGKCSFTFRYHFVFTFVKSKLYSQLSRIEKIIVEQLLCTSFDNVRGGQDLFTQNMIHLLRGREVSEKSEKDVGS